MVSCADRRPTCPGQAGRVESSRVESGSWGDGGRGGEKRTQEWAAVGPRWLYDFQQVRSTVVGAGGPGTAAKGLRVQVQGRSDQGRRRLGGV